MRLSKLLLTSLGLAVALYSAAAQAAVVDQPVLQAAVPGVQVGQQLGQRAAGALDGLGAAGVAAQDRRDADLDCHR